MPIGLKREAGSGLLPDGIYRVVIEDVKEKPGPSGHPYLNMRLRPYVKGQKSGATIWDKISLSPDSRFRVDAFLDAINAPEDGNAEAAWFVGKSYWASVKSREYQGQWSNEVVQYLTPEAAEKLLEKKAQEDGFGGSDEEASPIARAAAKKGGKKAAPIAELSEDDSPF